MKIIGLTKFEWAMLVAAGCLLASIPINLLKHGSLWELLPPHQPSITSPS